MGVGTPITGRSDSGSRRPSITAIRFGQGSDAAIGVAFADNPSIGPPVTRVTVSTAAGQVSDPVRVTGSLQSLRVPAGSDWLRITVTGLAPLSAASLDGTQAGIATIDVPGLSASRTIVAPPVPAGSAGGQQATVVLAKAQPYQPGCELAAARWVCSPVLATTSEEQYGSTSPSPSRPRRCRRCAERPSSPRRR